MRSSLMRPFIFVLLELRALSQLRQLKLPMEIGDAGLASDVLWCVRSRQEAHGVAGGHNSVLPSNCGYALLMHPSGTLGPTLTLTSQAGAKAIGAWDTPSGPTLLRAFWKARTSPLSAEHIRCGGPR